MDLANLPKLLGFKLIVFLEWQFRRYSHQNRAGEDEVPDFLLNIPNNVKS